jgi:predicted transcriptional regulator
MVSENARYAFVMMIQEKWWRRFLELVQSGAKVLSYVRGGNGAPPKNTSMIFFYVAKPKGQVAGYAQFVERKVGDAEDLWKKHAGESALESQEKYEEFIGDRQIASFVRFKNLCEASKPIPLKRFLMLLGMENLSRKGLYVGKATADKLVLLMSE